MTTVSSELFVPLFPVLAETVVPTSRCEGPDTGRLEIILLSFRAGCTARGGPSTERYLAIWPQL